MMNHGMEHLLALLPEAGIPFIGSEYPFPVASAILAQEPDPARLREWLAEVADDEPKRMAEPAGLAAELIESVAPDRDTYFLTDDQVRGAVFGGAKWRAGWVLVAGEGVTPDLVTMLQDRRYEVFSTRPEAPGNRALPARETGSVYFLQLMVRYAMTWGLIPPGEDHEMGHFLERDMPGAMVVKGAVAPAEALVLLALMKLGCPAVVDSAFPFESGPRAMAETDEEILVALSEFPNMRVRVFTEPALALPGGADPANSREDFVPARVLDGVFTLAPGDREPGVDVSGDACDDHIAVTIEAADSRLSLPLSAHLEAQALSYSSWLPGLRAIRRDNSDFSLELANGAQWDGRLLAEVIQAGLLRNFPRLGPVHIMVQFGAETVERERHRAADLNRRRDAAILAESEDTCEEFIACIDCQPFSHAHVCILTPDRPAMCGRSRYEIAAAALWGANYRPWTRRDRADDDLQRVVPKGETIDAAGGEWSGVNAAVSSLTDGKLQRVRIHAVGQFPHTSCGCFAALAFAIPNTPWLGVMERGYEGTAPGGLTWSQLANKAGGKQAPGVTGVSLAYLSSPRAFAGEGGLGAIRWVSPRVGEVVADNLPIPELVATGDAATTVAELQEYVAKAERARQHRGGGGG